MAAEVLPTEVALARRLEGIEQNCCLCGFEEESMLHIFKDCDENMGWLLQVNGA